MSKSGTLISGVDDQLKSRYRGCGSGVVVRLVPSHQTIIIND
jgi:hypothetical protein